MMSMMMHGALVGVNDIKLGRGNFTVASLYHYRLPTNTALTATYATGTASLLHEKLQILCRFLLALSAGIKHPLRRTPDHTRDHAC
jgi:hypothetical protein